MSKASTPNELQLELGHRLQALRLARGLRQSDVAAKAGVSTRAIHRIEAGAGSTVETLIRVARALGIEDALTHIAATPAVSPIALLERSAKQPQRARPRRER